MKKNSRTSRSGGNTSLLFFLGGLTALLLFLSGRSSSPREKIKRTLTQSGYSPNLAKWWAAVSDHETGTWTSNLYRNAHNLFGMKQPLSRPTLSVGATSSGFASFNNDQQSIDDLLLYLNEFNYPKDFLSLDDFIAFMKTKRYFEDRYENYYNSVAKRVK
jgi:hypothetical protein